MGMRQFECGNHIVVAGSGYAKTSCTLPEVVGGSCSIREVHVEPYDPTNVRETLLGALKPFTGQKIGFNLVYPATANRTR